MKVRQRYRGCKLFKKNEPFLYVDQRSRGSAIVEDDLVDAPQTMESLQQPHSILQKRAFLEKESKLWGAKNCFITPHMTQRAFFDVLAKVI